MFLSDQIVKMVLEINPQTYEDEMKLLNDILKLCHNKLSENLRKNMNNCNIIPSTKQICNIWDLAAKILEEKEKPFLKIGGFKEYLLSNPELAKILNRYNF